MTDSTDEASSTTLWDFAVQLYGGEGVRDVCLDLQERCGLDVDLLLFAVWSAVAGPGQLDVTAFRECIALTEAWRETLLKPLRALRRTGSGAFDRIPEASSQAVAARLQAAELAAERVELELLENWALARRPSRREPEAAAASNLVAYLAAAGVATATGAPAMRTLLAAAFRVPSRA